LWFVLGFLVLFDEDLVECDIGKVEVVWEVLGGLVWLVGLWGWLGVFVIGVAFV
jgi:hypothetical protein